MPRRPLDFSKPGDRKRWATTTPLGILALLLCAVGIGIGVAARLNYVSTLTAAVTAVTVVGAAIALRSLGERWETWKLAGQHEPHEDPLDED